MSGLPITAILTKPVRERFPNRYTGGYDASTVIDKLRWTTISSASKAPLSRNSNMGGETIVAKRVYPPPPLG